MPGIIGGPLSQYPRLQRQQREPAKRDSKEVWARQNWIVQLQGFTGWHSQCLQLLSRTVARYLSFSWNGPGNGYYGEPTQVVQRWMDYSKLLELRRVNFAQITQLIASPFHCIFQNLDCEFLLLIENLDVWYNFSYLLWSIFNGRTYNND